MKHSIIRTKRDQRGMPMNASDGKQAVRRSYNSSERTIKSQRFRLKNLTSVNPKKGLQAIEEVGCTTVESGEHHAGEIADKVTSIKKPSELGTRSAMSGKTKVETFI